MQVTTTPPRARRRPFIAVAISALLALVAGTLVSTQSDAATKYPYKAPPSVAVANVGKDYAEIVFGTVTGAPRYRIKAEALDAKGKVVAGKTKTTSTGPEGFWTITGLSPATKYKFTVAVEQPSPKKLLSKYSTKSATATTNKASYLDAPISLKTRDDPNDQLDKDGQRPYSIDLMWLAPKGFDPALHQFQIDYATDRVMKAKKGLFKTPGKEVVPQASPQQASAPLLDPAPSMATTEPSTAVTTEPSTDTTIETPTGQPAETPDASPSPSGDESTSGTEETAPASTPTESEPPAGQVAARAATGAATDIVLLSVPILPAVENPTAKTYWAQVPKLTSNTNWYMRVKIIRKSDSAVLSERSEALMVKTLSPKGYITGAVNLNGQPAKNYVVAAYKGNDLHDQVDLKQDGSYQLSVRPGSYNVVAVYIGSGNFSSRWAATDPAKGKVRYDDGARSVTVAAAKPTGGVNITPQSTPSFSISGDIDCPGAASTQCTVDVAAMSNWHTDSKRSRVVNAARSNSSGTYSITGLPAGKYKLRISHADERYKVKTLTVTVGAGNVTNANGNLVERAWVKTYPAKFKRTGSTLKVSSKAWIASELPVVRGVQKCQWQRNGANIGGATKCTYKLTAADRGKSIRVRIKNDRYGFVDNTTYSKAVRG